MKSNLLNRKRARHLLAGLLAVAGVALGFVAAPAVLAQMPDTTGIGRTAVLRHDLDKRSEAIQVRVDFAPGSSFPAHSHPGPELAFVLEGTMQYVMDGKTHILKTGQSLFIPAGAVHSARNAGPAHAAELATYFVEKGKPVVVLSK